MWLFIRLFTLSHKEKDMESLGRKKVIDKERKPDSSETWDNCWLYYQRLQDVFISKRFFSFHQVLHNELSLVITYIREKRGGEMWHKHKNFIHGLSKILLGSLTLNDPMIMHSRVSGRISTFIIATALSSLFLPATAQENDEHNTESRATDVKNNSREFPKPVGMCNAFVLYFVYR